MLDVAPITIGSACQIATRVQFLTATHPIDPEPRRNGWESGEPIVLGDNVWLSGGVIVCPGVTIGDDTVVGAGSVAPGTCRPAWWPSAHPPGCSGRSMSAIVSRCRTADRQRAHRGAIARAST